MTDEDARFRRMAGKQTKSKRKCPDRPSRKIDRACMYKNCCIRTKEDTPIPATATQDFTQHSNTDLPSQAFDRRNCRRSTTSIPTGPKPSITISNNGFLRSSCQDTSPHRLHPVSCRSNGSLRPKTLHEEPAADKSEHHCPGNGMCFFILTSLLSLLDRILKTNDIRRAPNP